MTEELRPLFEFVELFEGEKVDRAETVDLGAQTLDIGAQGLRFIIRFGFRFQQRFDGEAELVRRMLSESVPVGFCPRLVDLDAVQDFSLPVMGLATYADLFFELGNAGDDLVDLFRQTKLMFAGRCQETLFLDQAGP